MRLWDTLRTALHLADEVSQLRADNKETVQRFDALESEWTDVLDKLKAREERQRKRDQRAIRAGLASAPPEPVEGGSPLVAGNFDKEAARQHARSRGLIR